MNKDVEVFLRGTPALKEKPEDAEPGVSSWKTPMTAYLQTWTLKILILLNKAIFISLLWLFQVLAKYPWTFTSKTVSCLIHYFPPPKKTQEL